MGAVDSWLRERAVLNTTSGAYDPNANSVAERSIGSRKRGRMCLLHQANAFLFSSCVSLFIFSFSLLFFSKCPLYTLCSNRVQRYSGGQVRAHSFARTSRTTRTRTRNRTSGLTTTFFQHQIIHTVLLKNANVTKFCVGKWVDAKHAIHPPYRKPARPDV